MYYNKLQFNIVKLSLYGKSIMKSCQASVKLLYTSVKLLYTFSFTHMFHHTPRTYCNDSEKNDLMIYEY